MYPSARPASAVLAEALARALEATAWSRPLPDVRADLEEARDTAAALLRVIDVVEETAADPGAVVLDGWAGGWLPAVPDLVPAAWTSTPAGPAGEGTGTGPEHGTTGEER